MAYQVIWLPKAEKRFEEIINYLQQEWTDREVRHFVQRTEKVILLISQYTEIYRKSTRKNVREAIITKYKFTSL